MDTPAPLRVIPTKLDQTTPVPVPVPAEEVSSTYKRGNLPFRGPPTTELGLGRRKARTPPAEGELALGKRKARTPPAEGGATAAESPTTKTKRLSRVSATSTSEKKRGSKASERSAIISTSGAGVTATIESPLPYHSIREGGNLSVQDHSHQQRVPQNDGAEASDEVAGGSGSAWGGKSASDAVPPETREEAAMAATSQKGRDQRIGSPREAKSAWWGTAAKGSTPTAKWWDDAPSVRSKIGIVPANMLPAGKPQAGGGNQQKGFEATTGGEPAQQANASGKKSQ